MSKGDKVATDGGAGLGHNPFGALSAAGLPQATHSFAAAAESSGATKSAATASQPAEFKGHRGRVEIRRTTAGRGGKTVTLVSGFIGIGGPEKERLAKKMRAACGCGGTVKDGAIEIQGDQRETVARILAEAGFKPVFAGG